jgi:hypothetical protein
MGQLAYQACRKEAAWEFAVDVVDLGERTASWPEWYGSRAGPASPPAALGIKPPTWQQYCDRTVRAAELVHEVARRLRAHGNALAAVANGKAFDPSGIGLAGDAVGAESAKLGADTGAASAAHDAGSALATVTATLVQLAGEKDLALIIRASDGCMARLFVDLRAFALALDEGLRHAEEDRRHVVTEIAAKTRGKPPVTDRALTIVEGLEVVGEGDRELEDLRLQVSAYRTAIEDLKEAHANLAALADPEGKHDERVLKDALGRLETSVQALTELER